MIRARSSHDEHGSGEARAGVLKSGMERGIARSYERLDELLTSLEEKTHG